MNRYLFTVAYDGSSFSGWQIQKKSPTVQEELEQVIGGIVGHEVRIHASGRTDAGVHALGQVFHVDIPGTVSISEVNWPQAINARLPYSIRVLNCRAVEGDFHARFSAVGKTYSYRLVTDRILMPFDFSRAGHYPHPMRAELFEQAISEFAGTHDFSTFAAIRGNEPDPLPDDYYIRHITEAAAIREKDGYTVRFSGNGFLYRMVRLMIGTAHAVAREKITWDAFCDMLHHPCRQKSRYCAVPHGLTLVKVNYGQAEAN